MGASDLFSYLCYREQLLRYDLDKRSDRVAAANRR